MDTGSDTETDTGDFRVDTDYSLADAITDANNTPGHQTITIEPGWTTMLSTTLPTITETVTIIGAGNLIDGSGTGGQADCMRIASDDVYVSGLEINNCAATPIDIESGINTQITDCIFRDNGAPLSCSSVDGSNIPGSFNTIENSLDSGITSTWFI